MDWLRRQMVGRYGMDQLGYALIIGSLFFLLLQGITGWGIFGMLELLLLVLYIVRLLSKDYNKRSLENQRFLFWWNPIGEKLSKRTTNIADLRTHCHFKCPSCGQKVRVPRGRGQILVKCPGCRNEFIKKT